MTRITTRQEEAVMRQRLAAGIAAVTLALTLGVGGAWAQAKITVTREESKPQNVEVKAGEEVRWVNASGGTAHIWFGGKDAPKFYLGKEGRIKFDKPRTYEYTVHITGTKAHEHTGTVVVK
jgi:plastocyanin